MEYLLKLNEKNTRMLCLHNASIWNNWAKMESLLHHNIPSNFNHQQIKWHIHNKILHSKPNVFWMVLLVDSIYLIPNGLQVFVLLKVTKKEIQQPFWNLNTLPSWRINSIIVSREEGGNIDSGGSRILQHHLVGDILPFNDLLDSSFFHIL